MTLGITCAAHTEGKVLLDKGRQLVRIVKPILDRHKLVLALGRITAKGENIVNPAGLQPSEDGCDLISVRPDTCQVRHRFDTVVALNLRDEFDRTVPCASAGAVRDGDERRVQIAQ